MLTAEGVEVGGVPKCLQSVSLGSRPLPLAVFGRHRDLEGAIALHHI